MAGVAVALARIALLEDEPRVAERLESELTESPGTIVRIAETYRDFTRLVRNEQFDAASIDWELHGVEKGGEALRLLTREQPSAARVVFTKHELRKEVASDLSADACLIKGSEMSEYQNTMERAVRLGQARQIVSCLERLEEGTALPKLRIGRWIEDAEENQLRDVAHASVIEHAIQDTGYPNIEPLQSILQRRGWWKSFNLVEYSELTWEAKLKCLCQYAGLKVDELQRILVFERPQDVQDFMRNGRHALIPNESLGRADTLLSILAYQLRISNYRPDVMQTVCVRTHLYDESHDQPPWNETGLLDYLLAGGAGSLQMAFEWISR